MSSSITERLAALLEHTPPFDHLSASERQNLIGDMTLEIYEPGEVIREQGSDVHRAIHIVESGLVRLYDHNQNRLITMVGEGSTFGSYGLLQGGILPYEAKAVEPTVCALLSAAHFQDLYKNDATFAAHFDEDLKQYVRTLDTEMDASGAFLLFDTSLANILYRDPLTCGPEATVKEAAELMRDNEGDTVLIMEGGSAMGLVTEGDLVDRIIASGASPSTPVMELVERPPITLDGSARLFDAVRVMMEYRIRRVVITSDKETDRRILGVISAGDIAHFRGLDPVATVERLEKARSVGELGTIRGESNRRLFRLYQQGVQSEALLEVVAEMDDQLKARLLHLVEREAREARSDLAVDLPWAWIAFGAPGRREAALYTSQSNGLVYADPSDDEADRAAEWFTYLAEQAVDALAEVGIRPSVSGILASEEAFCQPLSQWRAAYAQWVEGSNANASLRAALCFDLRSIYGDTDLVDDLRDAIREHLDGARRFLALLMRDATERRPPISFFGRFELEKGQGDEGLNLRERGLDPIVDLARVLALEAGFLKSTNTFDRLRHLREAMPELEQEEKTLLGAFATLSDIHLRSQMQAAETGVTPSDLIDPNDLHKSQQNLLKETFKKVDKVQQALQGRYERG
jgi:CBS domain-containing protein